MLNTPIDFCDNTAQLAATSRFLLLCFDKKLTFVVDRRFGVFELTFGTAPPSAGLQPIFTFASVNSKRREIDFYWRSSFLGGAIDFYHNVAQRQATTNF